MEQDRHSYHLSIKKIQNSPDQLTIKISKNAQKCSLVANFAAHTCDNEQNLFAPFKTAAGLKNATFGDAANPDCFLWNIPEFGLLKLQRDGSMFFGHGQNDVPLAHDELTFNTPGTLFLESLKVAALKIKSEKAQLCQAVVADQVHADHSVQNSGCLKTKRLVGPGEFLNEGLLELEGTRQKPAILGIKKFQNKNKLPLLAAKVQSSHLRVTGDNQCFSNGDGALFDVSDSLWVEKLQSGIASLFCNKGSLTTGQFDLCRQATNEGFLQAHTMTAKEQQFDNKEFGQVKILDAMYVDSSIVNEGELNAQRIINVNNGVNKGTITGSPDLSLDVRHTLDNYGQVKISSLSGEGVFKNHRNLFFNNVYPTTIQTLINQTLAHDKKAKIEGRGLYIQGGIFLNEVDSDICLNGNLSFTSRQPWLGIVSPVAKLACNKGNIKVQSLHLFEEYGLENSGNVEIKDLRLEQKTPLNNLQGGSVEINGSMSIDKTAIKNAGELTTHGNVNLTAAHVENKGTMICKQGNLSYTDAKLDNAGNVLMDGVKSSDILDVTNSGMLALKDSALNFGELKNEKDLVLHSGVYAVNALTRNKRLQLLDQDWVITDDPKHQAPHRLLCMNSPEKKSWGASFAEEIECQRNLRYDLEVWPGNVRSQADVCLSSRYIRDIDQLKALQTPGKVTAWCGPINLIEEEEKESESNFLWGFNFAALRRCFSHYDFSNIGHLALNVFGPFTTHYSFQAPTLSMHVLGPLVLGKDNEHLGTLAATHGPLTVQAHSIDGRFGKFYGNGKTLLESYKEDITVGAPTRGIDENIKQQFINAYPRPGGFWNKFVDNFLASFDYTLNQPNGAYAASDNHLTLRSAKNIFVKYGTVISALGNHLIAQNEVQNLSGKISSQGGTTFEADTYNHTREGAATKSWTSQHDYYQYPGSGPAVLESLKKIDFLVKKVNNRAGSIRCGEDIGVNGSKTLAQATEYVEEPQHFYHYYFNHHGRGCDWGAKGNVIFTQSCTTQAGDTITMNLGNFVITGTMNAAGKISIQANTGLFANNNSSRQTQIPTQPVVVDVTHYMQDQARRPGMYRLGNNNAVETEFPLGAASAPQDGDRVLLENPGRAAPLAWADIFNPLNSVNLDLHLQQLLANLAGKVYAGKAKGNNLATILWANANKWRQQHGKDVMSPADMKNLNTSMLLCQILNNGLSEQQQILLCIAPADINPYQDRGDIVADAVECITEGDQTHLNNRIVAQGPDGITLTSKAGNVHLETQKYTTVSETDAGTITQQHAMPQQQLIAQSGPVAVTAHGNISRTGTVIAAAGDVDEHAQTGSVIKNPLVLQTTVEKHHKERGLFSTTESTQTSVTHHVVPSTTISGAKLHDKAAVSINAVAPQDSATQKIIYESPNTIIEGLILANRTTSQSNTSSGFSEQSSFESKETPHTTPANIQAKVVELVGKNARVNANINAKELRDETEHGAQFVAKVAQMLCSGQSLASSPFMSVDAGYNAGYETMIPTMLMVEKIVRTKETGHMVFESALIDKNRTEIIGKFVETTYQLKQWQTSWNHTSQLIPDEALIVVALAITLATQGAGVELLAPLLTNITAATGMQLSAAGIAMVNAGISTVCSSAATSFLRTGDPINTVAQLASPAQLKSVAFSMASAGLCSQLGDMLNVNMKPELKSLVSHVKEQALRGTVDALLNVAINDAPVDKALGDACKQIPLKAVAAYAANKICTAYMNTISQKAAQTVVGGLSGFAMDNSSRGFVSGAVGALTAETIGDLLIADAKEISIIAALRLKAAGKPLSIENMQQAIQEEVRYKMNFAKIAASGIAALAKQNPSIALSTASNALDNDVAIRGSLYAMAEFQSMLSAASQAVVTLGIPDEVMESQLAESSAAASPNEQTGASEEGDQRPFVEHPNRGLWYKACISGDLILTEGRGKYLYLGLRSVWHKHPKCPFNVMGHGSSSAVEVDTKEIHSHGLDRTNSNILEAEGRVSLNATELAKLIRTAPNYEEGQHINLFSCECGADPDGIAQQLSDEMKTPVSAFTGLAATFGLVFASVSFDKGFPELKDIKTFYPQEKPLTNIPDLRFPMN